MDVMIQCHILHLATQTVWEFNRQLAPDSEEYASFQQLADPSESGAIFIRQYIQPIEEQTDGMD